MFWSTKESETDLGKSFVRIVALTVNKFVDNSVNQLAAGFSPVLNAVNDIVIPPNSNTFSNWRRTRHVLGVKTH